MIIACAIAVVTPLQAFGWGSAGHRAVVSVALQFDPSLRARIDAVMAKLPTSPEWMQLEATGLIPNNRFEVDKSDPDGWILSLGTDPEKSATFPDWARDYNGYIPKTFNKWHFYDLDYVDGSTKFVNPTNALVELPGLEQVVKSGSGGSRAWALAWVMHLVGDMHQPLHTTSRPLANGKSDGGGNAVAFTSSEKLHTFWDDLPNAPVGQDADAYVERLFQGYQSMSPAKKQAFDTSAKDLNLNDWVKEGRLAIRSIGYPSDHMVANYKVSASKIADQKILLAGARLHTLLESLLPA